MKRSARSGYLVAGLLVLGGAAYGCADFLVTPPQGQLDALTLQNRQGVEATLVGAYRILGTTPGQGLFGSASNWVLGSVASDDAHKGSELNDGPQATDIELFNWGTGGAHGLVNEKWTASYEGVARSNATIRLLNGVLEAKPGEIPDAVANSIRGQALFLRAHFHFEAWRAFGNIPYYVETDTDFRKPNLSSTEVVAAILRDLDEAIGLLPESQADRGRVHRWTARAYKGRVQVQAKDYAGGLTTLREVVASGPYQLMPNWSQVWTGFSAYRNGAETILAYQASVNDGEPNGENGNHGDRLNFPHSGSPFGCCGFHQPTQNLVNFFKVDANGLPLAISVGDLQPLSASAAWNASNETLVGGSNVPVDPRLDWAVGRDDVPYKDWGLHGPTWIRDPSLGGRYSPKKNVHEDASGAQSGAGWNNQHLNSVPLHHYRYADLLLLLAEAEVEAGSLENARDLVNQVRRRAGAAAQGCGLPSNADRAAALLAKYPACAGDTRIAVPINDPSIGWANYRIGEYATFPNQAYARTAVHYERRLELAMEGHRFFDLRRWDVAPDVLNSFIAVERTRRPHLAGASTFADRHRWYPIPTTQIQLSQAGGESPLQQNPGW